MTALFQPLGDVSRRQMVVDFFGDQPEGTVIAYETLEELLGVDRATCRSAVNAAKPGLERHHFKSVVAVRGVGYRIVHANEHLAVARVHQKKSLRQLGRAKSPLDFVDLSKLTEGERAAIVLGVTSIGMQMEYARRFDIRQTRLEAAQARTATVVQRSEEEIAELKLRLARLEATDEAATD